MDARAGKEMSSREAEAVTAETATADQAWWGHAARVSVIGIFVLLLIAFLFLARSMVGPVVAAAIISVMFGPLADRAARYRIPASLFALTCIGLMLLGINVALALLGGALADWSNRAPELATALATKAYLLERPLAAWHELQLWLATMLGTSAEPPSSSFQSRRFWPRPFSS
jgi:predicted PurR-regulated permease PerM